MTLTEAYAVHRDRLGRRGGDIDQLSAGASSARRTIPPPITSTMTRRRTALDPRDGCAHGRSRRAGHADRRRDRAAPMPRSWSRTSSPAATRMCLRNTSIWNFFDCCAISLPLPQAGRPERGPDAGRPQRPRPSPVPHRRRGGEGAGVNSSKLPQRLQQQPVALGPEPLHQSGLVLLPTAPWPAPARAGRRGSAAGRGGGRRRRRAGAGSGRAAPAGAAAAPAAPARCRAWRQAPPATARDWRRPPPAPKTAPG